MLVTLHARAEIPRWSQNPASLGDGRDRMTSGSPPNPRRERTELPDETIDTFERLGEQTPFSDPHPIRARTVGGIERYEGELAQGAKM